MRLISFQRYYNPEVFFKNISLETESINTVLRLIGSLRESNNKKKER